MGRKKRYIKGKIYIVNDYYLSRDNYYKPNRKVVAINNDKNKLRLVKIMGLQDNNGKRRKSLIPIENYSCLTKPSGIHPKVYKVNRWNGYIKDTKLIKTNCRLNKWDMKKISRLR